MSLEIARCEWCGRPVKRTGTRGPAPRYCTDNNAACRVAAHRARRAASTVRRELEREDAELGPVEDAHPAPNASMDEQVARAYLEARNLAGVFARLGADARPALAWRCARVAEALTGAISETIGEE